MFLKKDDVTTKVTKKRKFINTVEHVFEKRAWLITFILVSFIVFFAFRKFILLQYVYNFKGIASDSINALYPYIINASDYMRQYGLPKWSFNYGMGQNIFQLFLRDPFDIFLYILDRKYVAFGLVFIEITKILLTSIVFYNYIKILGFLNFTAIIGTLMYCFCSYMIIGGVWHFFSFEVLNMALLLLAFEQLLQHNKWQLFPIPFFFIGVTMPLNIYFYSVFLICYAFLRIYQIGNINVKNILKITAKIIILCFLGLLCSAPFFLENMAQIIESPRVGGANSMSQYYAFLKPWTLCPKNILGISLLRFFSNDILGKPDSFPKGINYFEAPMFYCGIPCILLIPQVFRTLNKKVKFAFFIIILLWLIPILFPYFRLLFWLFSGNYFRVYSFFVSFFILYYFLLALEAIFNQSQLNIKLLVITSIICIVVLFIPFFPPDRITSQKLKCFIVLLIITYNILFYLLIKHKDILSVKYLFLAVVVFEIYFATSNTVNAWIAIDRKEVLNRQDYNDYSIDALKFIKNQDKSFYRVDKNYGSSPAKYISINDGMVQKYNGTSSYSSFNQMYYVKYLQLLGVINLKDEQQSRWAIGLRYNPVLENENCVKYFLIRDSLDAGKWFSRTRIATFNNISVYKNKNALPLGITYKKYVKESIFKTYTSEQKQLISLKGVILKDKDAEAIKSLSEIKGIDTLFFNRFNTDSLEYCLTELRADTLNLLNFNDNYFSGNISLNEDKIMYLSIPYDKGWKLKVDGKPEKKIIINAGMTGILLPKGNHSIELNYDLRFFNIGCWLMGIGITNYVMLLFLKRRERYLKS